MLPRVQLGALRATAELEGRRGIWICDPSALYRGSIKRRWTGGLQIGGGLPDLDLSVPICPFFVCFGTPEISLSGLKRPKKSTKKKHQKIHRGNQTPKFGAWVSQSSFFADFYFLKILERMHACLSAQRCHGRSRALLEYVGLAAIVWRSSA